LALPGAERSRDHATREDADIIVVNTCSFIDSAKQESSTTILEMAATQDRRTSAEADRRRLPG